MTNSYLEAVRAREFQGGDRELYLHLGHFFAWYSQVDFGLTLILAIVMGEKDLRAFHTVSMGLDARTKVRRLKQLCAVKNRKIGPTLSARLAYFHRTISGFRNRASHTALLTGYVETQFLFSSLDRMPWKELGVEHAKATPAETIERLKVFEYGNWLHDFYEDLHQVLNRAIAGQSLDIDNPRSNLSQESHSNSPAPDDQPTPDKPAQTTRETED